MRECLVVSALVFAPGCSLILDFSDKAIPIDAAIDGPFDPSECDYKEPNDSIATAATITTSDSGPAAICPATPDDHDFYRFTVPAGATSVTVKIIFTIRPNGDLDMRLWDPANPANFIAQSRGVGAGETIICPGASPSCPTLVAGDYVFEVFPGVSGEINDYTFAVDITP